MARGNLPPNLKRTPNWKTVVRILSEFGWGCVDTGGIESSRYLEAMCLVWVLYGARTNTWNHAFKLLRR